MQLTHDFTVPADIETTWSTFLDLERVGGCFPGATVTDVTDDAFSGTVKVKLGPIALQYSGSGTFLERDDQAKRAVIEAKGKDKRGNGTAGATVTMHLAPSGTGTRVDVTTELQITGKPAQFGRGVMQDVSDKLLQKFISCIEGHLSEARTTDATSGEDEVPTPAELFGDAEPGGSTESAEPSQSTGQSQSAEPTRVATPTAAPTQTATKSDDEAIDLGATVLPVILKSYAPHIVGAVVAVLFGYLLGRRRGS